MDIYFKELDIETGYRALSHFHKHDRLVGGKTVARPSGWALFEHLRGQDICCRFCGIKADRWVSMKGNKDKIGPPNLNLFAGNRMMTRDHLIPKSLGGSDSIENLLPACSQCNEQRSNTVTPEIIEFAKNNQHLVCESRVKNGLESLARQLLEINKLHTISKKEKQKRAAALKKPFLMMGYLVDDN